MNELELRQAEPDDFLAEAQVRLLHVDTDVGYTASVRLLERCGFRRVESESQAHLLLVLDRGW
ncbi:hypothetical protein ITP53_15180 [Nonomuraea sp. K274]|uniref:Acetyltransferase (GNAT) family protein n=1 Tax=Nonomuraea cypriaca TaxID=1187855 RepID=A0A931EY85_9ACTN|nr:hypothetical protein [Nonomuraea cypriaca]MBF8187055.1 hypothetical protein [Nonomuraea cypriaca]